MKRQLKLYLDTHIAKAVATQLRTHGVDVVRCEEVEMATASDEQHLEYAVEHERVMVSGDHDFEELHRQWLIDEKQHFGILRVSPKLQGAGVLAYLSKK